MLLPTPPPRLDDDRNPVHHAGADRLGARVRVRTGALLALLLLAVASDAAALGVLENPSPGSTRSGIGVISGWVCSAQSVTLEIDGTNTLLAAYGTNRGDTRTACGDTNNGFGLLLNWNLLGDGPHQIRAFADGVEIGSASFSVRTLGSNFLRGVSGRYLLPGFAGGDVIVDWQEAAQNFVLIQNPQTRPTEIVASLRSLDSQERMSNENLPLFIRVAAEPLNPEVVELIATGSAALPAILAEFAGAAGYLDEVPLTLLAYALEQIGDPAAVPFLADWLEANLFSELLWAPDFVTHAIKVLDGQGGLDTTSFTYGIEQQLDTIAQARVGAATGSAAAGVARNAATTGGDSCVKTIVVTGIDAGGQERVVELPYRVYSRDIQDQIAAETNAQRKSQLERQRDVFLTKDVEFYGSTDYKPVPGGTVSVKSNCGGSVTERLLNEASARIGQPVVLGEGTTGADDIRDLARAFGTAVTGFSIDTLTVIAHEYEGGKSAHVEIPISASTTSAVVYSKDVQGVARTHTITTVGLGFDAVQNRYNFRPFSTFGQTTPKFYQLDPSRIRSIVVDSGACPCDGPGAVPVAITQPSVAETSERVVQVAGTVGDQAVTSGTLRVNGSPQPIAVSGGAFASEVVLRSGDNVLRATVDAADGARGCAERSIRSTTAKTTLSATLTWNLDRADVDLYVTQPDGETAWYSDRTTVVGGRLDVDNTSGFGPENYFLSSAEGDTVEPGPYVVRVHYYSDRDTDDDQPTRAVSWRVVVLLNEGTPLERRQITQGTLSVESSSNDDPGSSGPDWATATTVQFAADGTGSLVATSADGDTSAVAAAVTGSLEIPQPDSPQSGIGVMSGWVCDAARITLEVDGVSIYEAAYGTTRADTAGVCGDANNGFGVLLNWNLLGDGGHRIRAFADGVLFGEARIVVKTLGVPFLRDVSGLYLLPSFAGRDVTLEWQQSQQNFAIVDAD